MSSRPGSDRSFHSRVGCSNPEWEGAANLDNAASVGYTAKMIRSRTWLCGVTLTAVASAGALACASEPEASFLPPQAGAAAPPERSAREAQREPPAQPPARRAPAKAPAAGPSAIPAPPDVSSPPADAERTASGLASKVLRPGRGDRHPSAQDRVEVHYTGWQSSDGRMFDSSRARGRPATFPLNGVIRGWTEGLQLMVPGEQRRFWIPGELAYGNTPRGGRPSGMLVFDVELIRILDGERE